MADIYKAGEYFITAASAEDAVVLLELFREYGEDVSEYEIIVDRKDETK